MFIQETSTCSWTLLCSVCICCSYCCPDTSCIQVYLECTNTMCWHVSIYTHQQTLQLLRIEPAGSIQYTRHLQLDRFQHPRPPKLQQIPPLHSTPHKLICIITHGDNNKHHLIHLLLLLLEIYAPRIAIS